MNIRSGNLKRTMTKKKKQDKKERDKKLLLIPLHATVLLYRLISGWPNDSF